MCLELFTIDDMVLSDRLIRVRHSHITRYSDFNFVRKIGCKKLGNKMVWRFFVPSLTSHCVNIWLQANHANIATIFRDPHGIICINSLEKGNDYWRVLCDVILSVEQGNHPKSFSFGKEKYYLSSRNCTGVNYVVSTAKIEV